MIRFIFKTIIFIILLCIGVSFFASKPHSAQTTLSSRDGSAAALSSQQDESLPSKVVGFFSNLQGFCDRNPHSCELSLAFYHAMEARFKDGAQIIMEKLGATQ